MNIKKLQNEVPFDQYSRQFQVMTMLNELRKNGEKLSILDVGGYKGRTADFLSADTVTVLDLYDVAEPGYVKGSALKMPFEPNTFDYVLSFDVLEHIPSKQRRIFFDECARVAKRGVIICAPHKTVVNEYAETFLNEYYKSLHHKPHPWLGEHIEYGIPDFDKLETYASAKGYGTVSFPSNKTQLWTSVQHAIFTNSKYPLAAEQLVEINTFYNKNFEFDGGNNKEASYRLILCCLKESTAVKKLDKKFGSVDREISPLEEMQLSAKLNDYYAVLGKKTNQQVQDYQRMYKHELKRATTLQANAEQYAERLHRLESSRVIMTASKFQNKLSKLKQDPRSKD